MTVNLPRETLEFIPVNITVNGAPATSNIEICVTLGAARPVDWFTPITVDGQLGFLTPDHTIGAHHVWARVTDNPEIPVIDCGWYRLT